jgi:hypothetical protein
VVLDGREGHRVFVRQADPGDGDPPRIPFYPGDELVVMTVVAGIGHHLTPDVGRVDDYLFGQRVVPVRRELGRVFARTLRRGEVDDGSRVHLRPGEQLVFEEGSVVAELEAIDDQQRAAATGYTPLTPVMWTWLKLAGGADEARSRYLLAATRRLDAAARLLDQLEGLRTELQRTDLAGPAIQRAWFELIGTVELSVVAFGRVVDMASRASAPRYRCLPPSWSRRRRSPKSATPTSTSKTAPSGRRINDPILKRSRSSTIVSSLKTT